MRKGVTTLVSLPQQPGDADKPAEGHSGGCGSSCGAGMEKVYPSTAVRYGAMNWIGEFQYKPGQVFKCGGKVIIQTDRGVEIGEQVSVSCGGCDKAVSRDQIKEYVRNSGPEFYRLRSGRILREASAQDIEEAARLRANYREDLDRCALLAAQMNLDMKIVTVEYLFGGERVVFYFRAEQRVDFRELVRELARHHSTRIELRQVGARDEARLVADYEICGRECCCKNFLKKLRPISMKMAKLQKSTLDPAKVSGRCGRLRCCLRYEHEGYEELARKLPRVGKRVMTERGEGTVIDRQILTQLLVVRSDEGQVLAYPVEEVSPVDPNAPRPAPRPAESGGRREQKPRSRRPRTGSAETPSRPPATGEPSSSAASGQSGEGTEPKRRRRRRRRRGDAAADGGARPPISETGQPPAKADPPGPSGDQAGPPAQPDGDPPADGKPGGEGRPRRRRRRRGRRGRSGQDGADPAPPPDGNE